MPNPEEGRTSGQTQRGAPVWRIWLVSAVAPASVIAWLIATNVVDMPYWDDWFKTSTILVEWHAGTLGIDDLLRQHNGSRPLFPRLLFLALGEASKGRMTLQPALSVLLACLISWGVVLLGSRTLPGDRFPQGWPTRYAGWERTFDAAQLPPRPFHVSTWAFDADLKQAWPLEPIYRSRP
jgi:hypothetical protein